MKKRIAILRGNSLNRFEMQSYEPLLSEWDLTAIHSRDNQFDLDGLAIPMVSIGSYTELLRLLPPSTRKYANYFLSSICEIAVPLINPVQHLNHYDIIHTADPYYYYSYQAALAKQKFGCKLVSTHWENVPFTFGRRKWTRKRNAVALKEIDRFIAVTERAKETLLFDGVPGEKIHVIPVGIDLIRFQPSEKDKALSNTLSIEPQDRVILYVGRMVRSKGLTELLCAFWKLLNDKELANYSIKLLCVGSGEAKNAKLLLKKLGIADRVILAGNFSYNDLPKIHNLADVFVLPSLPTYHWREQLGIVLLESMACGKAIVSTLSGSIPEVIGDAGVLVQPYDHLSLFQAIKHLLLDEISRQELQQKARARAEKLFDRQKIASKIGEVYHSLLG